MRLDPTRIVKIKGGVLGTKAIDAEGVTALAALPPREVLQARLAGAIVSPVATLAGLFAANLRNLAYALQQVADQQGRRRPDADASTHHHSTHKEFHTWQPDPGPASRGDRLDDRPRAVAVHQGVRGALRRHRGGSRRRGGRRAAAGAAAAAEAPRVEEQTEFAAILAEIGPNKIPVIKVVRELTGLGLKEAKDLVDASPKPVKEGIAREEAEKIKAALEEQGAKVEIK